MKHFRFRPESAASKGVGKSSNRPDRWVAILFLALAALIGFDARRLQVFPAGSGTFLVLVAVGLAACAVALWVGAPEQGSRAVPNPLGRWQNPLYVAVVIAVYLSAIGTVGYLIATFGLVIALLLRLASYRLWVVLGLALIISTASYGVFHVLGTSLPTGWLESRLRG